MGWISGQTALRQHLAWATQEITALREERALLLRDLSAARDRGDQAVNALLEAKGERPLVTSPPPPRAARDPFDEDPDQVQAVRELIQTHGVEAAFYGTSAD